MGPPLVRFLQIGPQPESFHFQRIACEAPSWAIRVDVVDFIAYIEALDRDVRILKMDIEGAEWGILNRLVDHPILSRIDCIFVETHERQDPERYVPMFEALQDWAEKIERPYINLYWV